MRSLPWCFCLFSAFFSAVFVWLVLFFTSPKLNYPIKPEARTYGNLLPGLFFCVWWLHRLTPAEVSKHGFCLREWANDWVEFIKRPCKIKGLIVALLLVLFYLIPTFFAFAFWGGSGLENQTKQGRHYFRRGRCTCRYSERNGYMQNGSWCFEPIGELRSSLFVEFWEG